jgi:hypothetical protein
MSYMDWKAGDKIVCIETWHRTDGRGYGDEVGPIKGETYTIREVVFFADLVTVRLVEVVNPKRKYREFPDGNEPSFGAWRFRPVQTRKTSIEVFERLLTPSEHDKHLIEVHDFVSLQEPFQ